MAVNKSWAKTGLTGGTSDDLDGIAVALLSDDDFAYVRDGDNSYEYKYDSSSTASEDSPYVIKPDDAGSSGRWILQQPFGANGENLLLNPEFIVNQDVYNFSDSISAGNYYIDGWFNKIGNASSILDTGGGPGGGIVPAGDGASQLYGKRVFVGSDQISGIIEGETLTASIDAYNNPAASCSLYTGYGSSSSAALTLALAGTFSTTNTSISFTADYNSVSTNYLAIEIVGDLIIKSIKIERGSTSTTIQKKPFARHLRESEHYFRKSYNYGTPAGAITDIGAIDCLNYSAGATTVLSALPCKVPQMQSTPTVTIYSSGTGTAGEVRDVGGATDLTVASIVGLGDTGFSRINLTDSLSSLGSARFHYIFNARP